MIPPLYRRLRHRLGSDEIARLVALRDGGATWKEIGLVFSKQDCACKAIYDKAKQAEPREVRPADKAA